MESDLKKKKNKIYFVIPLDITETLKKLKNEQKYIIKSQIDRYSNNCHWFLRNLFSQAKCNNLFWDYEYAYRCITQRSVSENDRLFYITHGDVYDAIRNYRVTREVIPEHDFNFWEIPKDILLVYLFKHVSIQDLGRLEQTSKRMKHFIETHDLWKNVIVKRDISFYGYPRDTPSAKDYLKNLLTGKGFAHIKKNKEEECFFSCDGKQVLFVDFYTLCGRVMCALTGDYYFGFKIDLHIERFLCFQGDLILYVTRHGESCLKNYKTNDVSFFEMNVRTAHIYKDTIYLIDKDFNLNLYNLKSYNLSHKRNLKDNFTDIKFHETYLGLCIRDTEIFYDIELDCFFKQDPVRYKLILERCIFLLYDEIDEIGIYSIKEVMSIEFRTYLFLKKINEIKKIF
jgi:hypothetical protein